MRNVLDRLPQREQSEAKDLLRAVVYAPSRAEAVRAREAFARRYRPWYPKAVDVLEDDWERMASAASATSLATPVSPHQIRNDVRNPWGTASLRLNAFEREAIDPTA